MNAHLQVLGGARALLARLLPYLHPAARAGVAACLFAFALPIVLPAPWPCQAATLALDRQQGHERLTIALDEAPSLYNLLRDSRTSLTLTLPAEYWDTHPKPAALRPGNSRLVKGVEVIGQAMRIELASPAFGFIHQLDGKILTVDVFTDPLGARWEPAPAVPAAPVSTTTTTDTTAQAAANATPNATAPVPPPAPANATAAIRLPVEQAPENGPPANVPAESLPPAATAPAAPAPAATPAPPATEPAEPAAAPAPEPPAEPQPWRLRAPVLQRELGDPLPGSLDYQATAPSAASQALGQALGQAPGQAPGLPPAPQPALPALPPVPAQNATPGVGADNASASDTAPGNASSSGQNATGSLVENTRRAKTLEDNTGWIMTPEEALAALAPRDPAPGEAANASKPYVPDFEGILNSGRAALVNGDYNDAIAIFDALRVHPQLPRKFVEEVLYSLADAHFAKAGNDYRTHFDTLTSTLIAAMNQNPRSPRTPEALLKLGLINLTVGNGPEADAYFSMLLREFPNHPNVPLVYYYQGKNFFDHGQFQEAADKFQYVVQQFPDSRHVREAAVGLAEALYKLGYDAQALQIVDYIEKRWPRFYVEYPPILKLSGEVAARNAAWERARINYWTYYNLSPDGDDADIILARIGDVYQGQNSTAAAREIYQQAASKYPDKDGGLISLMRLAENGVHDAPSVEEMFTVFDRPFSTRPADIYQRILAEHPDSSLAPLARLKLAMWRLFNTQEREALADVEAFLKDYPRHELTPQAMDVAGQAFQAVIANQVGQENFPGIVVLCNEYPMISENLDRLPPATQTAMALAFWKTGQPARALAIVDPLLARPGMPEESEMALQLATSIHLESKAWDKIVGLHETVQDWELSPRVKDEFDYALALAYENLQSPEKSQAIWEELADKQDLGVNRIAYTKYFLAIEARKRENLKAAYEHGMDALSYFLESGEDPGKVMDLMHLLMDVSDVAGRPRDALKWAIEYGNRLDPADSRWPAMRYRTAQLYKKVQDDGQWRTILEELATQMPNSPFGRMAAMDLKGATLEEGVSQYTPPPPL